MWDCCRELGDSFLDTIYILNFNFFPYVHVIVLKSKNNENNYYTFVDKADHLSCLTIQLKLVLVMKIMGIH